MGRIPCCEKDNVKRGQWTPEEDNKLASYIAQHGTRNWRLIPKSAGAGLQRCGKSCRLRWTNYLRPDLNHSEFSEAEEQTIMRLHAVLGNRWSIIAAQLPGRTDNDVKNYWNTKLKKKLSGMGIDPVTHKPFSHLMAEIAMALPPPHVAHLAEAALGCFKDEMLHQLTKKRIDFQLQQSNAPQGTGASTCLTTKSDEKEDTVDKIRLGLSRTILEPDMLPPTKQWEQMGVPAMNFIGECSGFPPSTSEFQCGHSGFGNKGDGSPWNPSMCTRSMFTAGDQQGWLDGIIEEENEEESKGEKGLGSGSSIFNSDCVLWDLPADDLVNPIM